MNDFSNLLLQGNAWFFIPTALFLGAIHGLEPGHSKTMMAAFIISVRGTWKQAILLGLSATLSHTAIVWIIALGGLYFGQKWNAEDSEPYLQVISAVLIIITALWMIWRVWKNQHLSNHDHHHNHSCQSNKNYNHLNKNQNSHELAHTYDISHRFDDKKVTTGQIIIFGLTGGLIPCPASITVLLICLQLKKITLGLTLVLCFSIGLAVTLTMSGVIAALGIKHISKKWEGFNNLLSKLPYISGILILLVGLYLGYQSLKIIL